MGQISAEITRLPGSLLSGNQHRKAEAARQQLFAGSSGTNYRAAERIARLAFLAPDIIMAILEGRHPPSLTARRLMKHAAIPLDWKGQRKALGFG